MSEPIERPNGRPTATPEDTGRDPVEELAAEFATRVREGDHVTIDEYARRNPTLASEIRELFPTVLAMEQLNAKRMLESGPAKAPSQIGDYRIIAEIARGGMGIVYEAEQVSLGRRVAVKVLPAHALRREKDVRRFEREALTAANLHHTNIVPVFGAGQENGQRYIVMQLIRGVGLDEILREIRNQIGSSRLGEEKVVSTPRISTAKRSAAGLLDAELTCDSTVVNAREETVQFDTRQPTSVTQKPVSIQNLTNGEYFRNVARIGMQAAEALQYAHQNKTLHRDIKPGNLLLDESGRVWIADFGLAKALQDDGVTCSGDVVGTMAYVAPERFRGETTAKSDIYSLGVTLHEMVTLQKAFHAEDRVEVLNQVTNDQLISPRRINAAVPQDLETIILKAASKDLQDRYESAADLASDLQAFLEQRPISARRLSHVEHAFRWCRRNQGMAGLGAAVVVLVATVFGLLGFGYRHSEAQREDADFIANTAIGAFDQIFNQFASSPLTGSLRADQSDEEGDAEAVDTAQAPISKDVASLLENLLGFYGELATRTGDSESVNVKFISANRRVGDIKRRLGQLEDARLSYTTAIERVEQLASSVRDTATMRLEVARIHNGLGLTYHYKSWERVCAHRDAVAVLDIPNATNDEQLELATSLYLLDRAKVERDESYTQTRHLRRARDILGHLEVGASNRADYDLLLARCLLADPQQLREDGHSLTSNQQRAIGILESLIQRHPTNPDYRYELGLVYKSVEWTCKNKCRTHPRSTVQLAVSEARLRKGLEVTADLEVQHPNIPQYYLLKKQLHELLGRVLLDQARYSEARSQYDRSIQMQRNLMASDDRRIHLLFLRALEIDYARLLREADELTEAKTLLVETIQNLEDRLGDPEYRRSLRWVRRALKDGYNLMATISDQMGDAEHSRQMLIKADRL